jgi:class 3 adenylate cyclase/predicted ATPase
MPLPCPSCGSLNPPRAKYCGDCGTRLNQDAAPVPPPLVSREPQPTHSTSRAERRQLSVMFCDLVGSTALSVRLDPEDLRDVIGAYHTSVAETVARFKGFVAKYMGDGVLVYFGYPQAHEADAEDAVRAGLAMIEAVQRLKTGDRLSVRVGIATGLVVVGDLIGSGEAQERGVVGETPNLAARLQALAEPGTVSIDAGTRRLTGDLFEYVDLGRVELKGFAKPIQASRVVRESTVRSRFEALHGAVPLTPLVGREEELELLLRRWQKARSGEGQVVLISGEPGIGKSRLIAALEECLRTDGPSSPRYDCSPHHQDSAFFPIISQLEHAAGFERDDPRDVKIDKLEALLRPTSASGEDMALLAGLLSIPTNHRLPSPDLTPQQRRERTVEAVLRQVDRLSHQRPVLMVFEDVQWVDPTSREFLDLAVERAQHLSVLLIVTFRPEVQAPWTSQAHVTTLTLNRLDRHEGAALVQRIAGDRPLPSPIQEAIVQRADGVPLFVEELTKAVIEADEGETRNKAPGPAGAPRFVVPATLQASLMARLDRLGPVAKDVAQIGAAIGRDFPHDLLTAVDEHTSPELQTALDRLTGAGLVFRRGEGLMTVYTFKHALVQDAAYSSLLRGRRQKLHGRIARALRQLRPEMETVQPEVLAHHYAAAHLWREAVEHWLMAGTLALQRSASVEASAHLRRGLDHLANLPDGIDRARLEFELQFALGSAMLVAKGYAAPEAEAAFARAASLCAEIGEVERRPVVAYGQYLVLLNQARLREGQQLAEDLLRTAEDAGSRLVGHTVLAANLMARGELEPADHHFSAALSLLHETPRGFTASIGHDPRLTVLAFRATVRLYRGYLDEGARLSWEMIGKAREMGHVSSLGFALGVAARTFAVARRLTELGQIATELDALAREHRFPFWSARASICLGRVMIEQGQTEDGLAYLRDGLAAHSATGSTVWMSFNLGLLGDAYLSLGRCEEAEPLLSEALDLVERTDERWCEAELYRLKGQAAASRPNGSAQAEAAFQTALRIARLQQAKLFELRAATSLARLWRDQGQHDEARDLLSPVYGWFTEGFDTPDLKDARALLEEIPA